MLLAELFCIALVSGAFFVIQMLFSRVADPAGSVLFLVGSKSGFGKRSDPYQSKIELSCSIYDQNENLVLEYQFS